MRRFQLLVFGLLLAQVTTVLGFPDRIELVSPTEKIPRDGYGTWSLFLICTPDWVSAEKSGDLATLYRRFKAFGDAIGEDNLAVWFWKKRSSLQDGKLSENVDVARSATYCKALGVRPSEGPFLLVTSQYPDVAALPRDRAVFSMGALPPADLAKLLNTVTDKLLLGEPVDNPARPAPSTTTAPPPAAGSRQTTMWVKLLESTRTSIIGLGCSVKLQVSTGVVSAETRGCDKS